MWHRLRMLLQDLWLRWWPQPEIQSTILPEQLEYKQPELVEIELSTVPSVSQQITVNETLPEQSTRISLRISIPRELDPYV